MKKRRWLNRYVGAALFGATLAPAAIVAPVQAQELAPSVVVRPGASGEGFVAVVSTPGSGATSGVSGKVDGNNVTCNQEADLLFGWGNTDSVAAGSAVKLQLLGNNGNEIAGFSGALLDNGVLSLFAEPWNPPGIDVLSGYLYEDGDKGGKVLVALSTGGSNLAGLTGLLSFSVKGKGGGEGDCTSKPGEGCGDGGKGEAEIVATSKIAFDRAQTEWACDLPKAANTDGGWNFHVWTEVEFSPGKSGKTMTKKVDMLKTNLVKPWMAGDSTVSAVKAGTSSASTLALGRIITPCWNATDGTCQESSGGPDALVVMSDGWTTAEPPTELVIEIAGGETLVAAPHSYQRAGVTTLSFEKDPEGQWVNVETDTGIVALQAGNGRGSCLMGKCFCLTRGDEGQWDLAVTAYSGDAGKLPPIVVVAFPSAPAAEKSATVVPLQAKVEVALTPEVAAVFAHTVKVAPDAVGAPIAAQLTYGTKQPPYFKTKELDAIVVRGAIDLPSNGGGSFSLAATTNTGEIQSKGDILIGKDPIDIEIAGPDGEPIPVPPPVVVFEKSESSSNSDNRYYYFFRPFDL